MRVLAVCGSLRPASSTRNALAIALAAAESGGAEVGWVDLDGLPWCDGRAVDAYGPRVDAFRAQLAGADALLVGSPEYHGSFTGVLKNALDLCGPEDLRGKLIGLVATARGDAGAMNTLNHLRQVSRWVGAWVLPAQVSVPRAGEAFDAQGQPVRAAIGDELGTLGRELVRYGRLLAADGAPSV
ncbi:MAG: NAD(P)H-dependent oxidoreductase [Pseudomonadota bacterium]|nr:NAD(P)H-dependent oxidoreductase [Pseudomonadota bacterium]